MNDPDFITDGKGEFFVLFNTPLVRGYMPVPIPKSTPVLRWNGPKIDLVTAWYPALKFMQEHKKHEVVLRLFMSKDKETIYIFPLSQIYGTGMSVKEEITKEEREWWAKEGLIEAGTLHSHCESSAFASGTDKQDERTRDGLHLTVGKLANNQFDIHSRMVWTVPGEEQDGKLIRASSTTVQEPELLDWFIFPPHIERFIAFEPELQDDIIKYALCKPPPRDTTYPKEWKDKLLQKTYGITSPALGPGQKAWARGADGQMHMYDPTLIGKNLSLVDDIPGWGEETKKKDEGREDPRERESSNGQISAKAAVLWDLWSEVMAMVACEPELRERKVRVAEFGPATRAVLINRIPAALETWEQMERMFRANNVTEEEFFGSWEKTSWPQIDDEFYYSP